MLSVLVGFLFLFGIVACCLHAGFPCGGDDRAITMGGGWSFLLQRRCAMGAVRVPAGPVPSRPGWWYAGTTIQEVQRSLHVRNESLTGHPSILTATLGGWIFSNSHGSGGTLWRSCLGAIVVRDLDDGIEFEVPSAALLFRSTRSLYQQRRYRILAVEVRPTVDQSCEQIALDVNSLAAAREIVNGSSFLRILFIDASNALAFVWKPVSDEGNAAPSRCHVPPWAAVSLLPSWLTARLDRQRWRATTTLRRANAFVPTPPVLTWPFMLLYLNYEVFVRMRMDAYTLLQLCSALRSHFAKHGGRCAIRFGTTKTFFDVAALRATHAPRAFFQVLFRILGPNTRVTLHKGKAQVAVAPLQLTLG